MTNTVRPAVLVALPWLLLLGVVACTVGPGGGPPTGGGPSDSPVADSPVGADSPVAGGVPPSGGSSAGSAGGGPSASDGSGGALPDPGTPTVVVPKPGRLGPHPVGATSIDARIVGGRVVARLTWWSGVAPCTVLDSVTVEQAGRRITPHHRRGGRPARRGLYRDRDAQGHRRRPRGPRPGQLADRRLRGRSADDDRRPLSHRRRATARRPARRVRSRFPPARGYLGR